MCEEIGADATKIPEWLKENSKRLWQDGMQKKL